MEDQERNYYLVYLHMMEYYILMNKNEAILHLLKYGYLHNSSKRINTNWLILAKVLEFDWIDRKELLLFVMFTFFNHIHFNQCKNDVDLYISIFKDKTCNLKSGLFHSIIQFFEIQTHR